MGFCDVCLLCPNVSCFLFFWFLGVSTIFTFERDLSKTDEMLKHTQRENHILASIATDDEKPIGLLSAKASQPEEDQR